MSDPVGAVPPEGEVVYHWSGPPVLDLVRYRHPTERGTYTAHALRAQGGRVGVVVAAGDEDGLVLVEQLRPTVGSTMLELPRGFGDAVVGADEHAAWRSDAERELREETGLVAARSGVLGSYVADSSLLPGRVAAVEVRVRDRTIRSLPDGEVSAVVWTSWADLAGLIGDGTLCDGHTLAALSLLAFRSTLFSERVRDLARGRG